MKQFLTITTLVLMAFAAYGYPVKSNEATKGIVFEDDSAYIPDASAYIQDGLIAMWDGIENAGWGMHDDEATIWVDLTGNGFDIPISGETILQDSIRFSKSHTKNYGTLVFDGYAITLQCVIDRTETTGNFCILGFGYQTSRLFVGNQTKYGCRFGTNYFWTPTIASNINSISMVREEGKRNFYVYDGKDYVTYLEGDNNLSISSNAININGENAYRNYRNIFSAHCIRLYNRALSESEIAYNYLIDKERFGL